MKYLHRKPGHADRMPKPPKRRDTPAAPPAAETIADTVPEYVVAYAAGVQRVLGSWAKTARVIEAMFKLSISSGALHLAAEKWVTEHVAPDAQGKKT